MTIYIPMIILTVFLADIQERIRYRGRKISILLITLLPPTLVAAFRYNNGADYPMYFQLFTRLGNGSKIAGIEGKKLEVGFEYIVRLCQLVTRNQWFTFGAISFIISFLIFKECPAEILSIIRSTAENKVIHLHGMYDERDGIDNIIADYIQYQTILRNSGAQFIQNLIGTNPIIIVGCGGTMEDPNLSGFMSFAYEKLGTSDIPYFYLMKSGDTIPNLPMNAIPVFYGDDYEDLPLFLSEIAMTRLQKRAGLQSVMHIRAAFIIASEAIYSPSAEYKRVPDKIINKAKQWSEQYPKKIEFQEAYFGLLFSRLKYAQAQDMRNEQRRVYREMKTVAERANYSEYNESNQLMESVDILHRVFGY